MISYLSGTILEKLTDTVIIEVSGVGYEFFVTPRLWQQLKEGSQAKVYTHLQVRDDAHVLYGFASLEERSFFRLLLTVNGVGPKTGLAIMSIASLSDLSRAIQKGDEAYLKAPGVGPKTVKRILVDLKDKIGSFEAGGSSSADGEASVTITQIILALEPLGYSAQEIRDVIHTVDLDAFTLDEAIKTVLMRMRKV